MYVYHISFEEVKEFVPRIPKTTYLSEDRTINRICVSSSIQKAMQAAPSIGIMLNLFRNLEITPILYVYRFNLNDFSREEYKAPFEVKEYVADAIANSEFWLLKTPTKYTCSKYYITDFLTKELEDMFGVKEPFCICSDLKRTKTKKNNYDFLLEKTKTNKYSKYIEEILNLENFSIRTKLIHLKNEEVFNG